MRDRGRTVFLSRALRVGDACAAPNGLGRGSRPRVQGRDVPALRVVFDRLEGRVVDRQEVVAGLTAEELRMVEQMRSYASLRSMSDEELQARLGTANSR